VVDPMAEKFSLIDKFAYNSPHGVLLQANPNKASHYVGVFLSNPNFMHLRAPYNEFVKNRKL
jgi:hypothetical protein